MDVMHPRCAGLDVSKRDAKVCVRIQEPGRARASSMVTTWGATVPRILALRDHLIGEGVTLVVMEATSDYWKPFYYVLEDGPFEVMLVNARHVKGLPGRKTDVSDAAWLAQLGAHGLVRGSFVPPQPIRELRDLTRTRSAIVRERGREIQRLEKLLEDSGVKLAAVASEITGVSGRAMLEALAAGERHPAVLAEMAKRRLRSKIPELTEALQGRFSDHHAFLVRLHLGLIDQHTAAIDKLTARIEALMAPFRAARDLMVTIPGISTAVADVIIAETGADMAQFPSAGHLASWAGTCPGSNESAGRVKSTRTRPGNPYLKAALGVAALSASRTKARTSPRSTGGSPRAEGRSRLSSPSSTPCTSPFGTCSPPAPLTRTSEATSTAVGAPTRRRTGQLTSYDSSDTRSAWSRSSRPVRQNLRISGVVAVHTQGAPVRTGSRVAQESEISGTIHRWQTLDLVRSPGAIGCRQQHHLPRRKAMNQLTVMGRLTKDPESPFNENAPAKFRLAIDRRGSDVTDYVDVAAFHGLGEIVVEHLKKGRRVIVTGSLRYSEWADAQGTKHPN